MRSGRVLDITVQDLVYNVDAGIGLRIIQTGLYVLLVFILLVVYQATQFRGLKEPEPMDLAQLGRNVMEQKAFVTRFVRPATMAYLREKSPARDPQVDRHPDLVHPPLYPLLLAGGFRLLPGAFVMDKGGFFPAERWVVLPLNHLFTLLSGVLLLLLGRRLMDFKTGLLAMSMYYLSNTAWADSIAGIGLPIVTFFMLVAFHQLLRADDRARAGTSWRRWARPFVFSALAVGLAALTRYAAITLLPGMLLFVGLRFRRRAWLPMLLYALIALAVISPWLVRNIRVCRNPLGYAVHTALNDSRLSAGDALERSPKPPPGPLAMIRPLQAKWLEKTAHYYRNRLGQYGDGLFWALFLTALFYRYVRAEMNGLRWAAALSFVSLFALAGFFGDSAFRLLNIFWPLVILYGLSFFYLLLDRLNLPLQILRTALIGLLLLLGALPLALAIMPPQEPRPYPPYYPPFALHVSQLLEPNEVICTDMPWATAWYGNRTSIYLPNNLDEFYEINDYQRRISGLYFTTLTRDRPFVRELLSGPYKTWFPILQGRLPDDFPLTQGFPINNLDQLFLTDRPRWKEK